MIYRWKLIGYEKRAEKIVYKNVVKATKSNNCHDI